jgi:hypothetical protein
MLIIILIAVIVVGAVVGNIYTIKKNRKAKVDPITQHVEELAPESTPAPVAVEAITVKVTPKQKVSKNTPKQKALAKVEAKPKAKKDNA